MSDIDEESLKRFLANAKVVGIDNELEEGEYALFAVRIDQANDGVSTFGWMKKRANPPTPASQPTFLHDDGTVTTFGWMKKRAVQ